MTQAAAAQEIEKVQHEHPASWLGQLFDWLGAHKEGFEALGSIGSVIGLFFVILGLWLTWQTLRQQIRNARATQHAATEAYARQKFEDYLREAYANPEFLLHYWQRDDLRPAQRERYRWFVKLTLWACEQILRGYPGDPEWPEVVREHVSYHAAYLCSERFDEFWTYEEPVRAVIEAVCAEHRRAEAGQATDDNVMGGPADGANEAFKAWLAPSVRYF